MILFWFHDFFVDIDDFFVDVDAGGKKFTQPKINTIHPVCENHLIFRLKFLNFQWSKSNLITTGETSGVSLKYIPWSQACIDLKPEGEAQGF